MINVLVTINCRRTGSGAYTTANCPKVNSSRTGNHWQEQQQLAPTDHPLLVVNITNSGKHKCFRIKVKADGSIVTLSNNRMIDAYHCVSCDEVNEPQNEEERMASYMSKEQLNEKLFAIEL